MVDGTLVLRKLSELDETTKQLSEFTSITVADYHADWKTQRIVERSLQIMLEICADIANHIVSDEGLRAPTSYADTFAVLGEAGAIDTEIEQRLREMVKFRNILVHGYDKIDEAIVVDILHEHLSDFSAYRDAIVAYLKRTG